MRNNKKSLLTTCFILLLVLFLVSCTSTPSSSTPTFTQTLTSSSPPESTIPTPTLTLTPTPTPTLTIGDIQGKLLSANTSQPLAGAAIILGLVTGEFQCTLQNSLVTTSDNSGNFHFSEVTPGTYVLFYNPSGAANISFTQINNLVLPYKLIGETPFSRNALTKEFHEAFGDAALLIRYEPQFSMTVGYDDALQKEVIKKIAGTFEYVSKKYGIVMQFKDGEPITLEVKVGKTTNIKISALVTDITPLNSSGS